MLRSLHVETFVFTLCCQDNSLTNCWNNSFICSYSVKMEPTSIPLSILISVMEIWDTTRCGSQSFKKWVEFPDHQVNTITFTFGLKFVLLQSWGKHFGQTFSSSEWSHRKDCNFILFCEKNIWSFCSNSQLLYSYKDRRLSRGTNSETSNCRDIDHGGKTKC